MAKSRRSVQFNHKEHRGSNSQENRPSLTNSEQDLNSQPGSPLRSEANGKTETDQNEQKPENVYEQKKQTFITRTIWTFIMFFGFFFALFSGHIYVIMLVTAIQIMSFKEVIAIASVPSKAKNLGFTRSLNWYFLGITMYYLYGESVIYYFKHIVLVDKVLLPFATHHRFIGFMLYVMGFVFFVGSLEKGHYRFQFTQFAWTHMALYFILGQAHFIMNNIFEGLFWFFLPASLVITNDIFAYICGITFGRTQLIKISPKKTVEGFVGAWIFTVIFGILFTQLLVQYTYFICPVNDLGANIFTGLQCTPNPVFVPRTYNVDLWNSTQTFQIRPIQLHMFMFATFASLIAPFGGFFASGLKRSFKIKDFGESIPGHGGITDRMDCQFIMGFFAFMYYQSFIAVYKTSVGGVIEDAIQGLSGEEQIEVIKGLAKHLVNQGIVTENLLECLSEGVGLKR